MRLKANLQTILLIMVLSLLLFACSGSKPETQVDPSASDNSALTLEPTLAPVSTEVQGTSINNLEQIAGVWEAPADLGSFFMLVEPDGAVQVAASLELLDAGSTTSWFIWTDGGQILADGNIMCGGEIGSYFGVIKDDDTLKITAIYEPCSVRMRMMDRSLPGRLSEYDLIYSRVR